jgi:alpha-glucoside transport system substrate-binding protein
MTVSRRDVLRALVVPCLAGLGAAGCGAGDQTVRVAVVWSGWELSQFIKVMNAFSERYGYGYSIESMGDDTSAFLSNEVTADSQPDVALVPQPGLVRSSVARLSPVGPQPDAPAWRTLLTGPGLRQYGVWFKAAYESMVWHRDDLPAPPRGWTWDRWVGQCRALARQGRPPLAIGAADGWVLAGWFANVLLSIDPASYRRLAARYATGRAAGTGPTWDIGSVRQALARLAELWQIDGAFPGGPEQALVTQFDQSVLDVFGSRQAAMVMGSDFFWPIITQYTSFPAGRVRWFPFPSNPPEKTPIIVGGDAAVLFSRSAASPGSRRLISWLATADAARIWARAGGFLSINAQVTGGDYPYPAGMRPAELISAVRRGSPDGRAAAFDLADELGGPLGGGDGHGTWKIFTDFFTDVAVRRSPVTAAIDKVTSALDGAAGGS